MIRTARLLLGPVVLGLALVACRQILGIDDSPPLLPSGTGGAAGASSSSSSGAGPGSSSSSGAVTGSSSSSGAATSSSSSSGAATSSSSSSGAVTGSSSSSGAGTSSSSSSGAGGGATAGGPWALFPLPPDTPPTSNYQTTADTVLDKTTGLEWQRDITAQMQVDGVSAGTVCSGVTAGGSTDWRLPSRMELLTLLSFEQFSPTINALAFPYDPSTEDAFWTHSVSLLNGVSPPSLWTVSFQYTSLNATPASGWFSRVRCVRVAQVKSNGAAPHYTVVVSGPKGLVRDNWTGLSWALDAPNYAEFAPGAAYCSTLALGPWTNGFRVPSMKELWSLYDETESSGSPFWDQTVFGPGPGGTGTPPTSVTRFWSATKQYGATINMYGLDFWGLDQLLQDDDSPAGYRIRCVHD